VRATGLVAPDVARRSLKKTLEKRRLPARLVDANLALFDEALDSVRIAELSTDGADEGERDHGRRASFTGYGELPAGAQSALRTSRTNRTSGYGRPGVKIEFRDETHRCNGCSLCVVQCPEGIIDFTADPARGAIVHGARFADFCKGCRECIAACPLDLFHEVAAVTAPDGALRDA
jgi:Pyruvate/2-oxoacid:ferredoxin oxidoreductase delta subunit